MQDEYDGHGTEVWTRAMAEGALEGADPDLYVVTPLSFDFAYSRFLETRPGPPRNKTLLKGMKRELGVSKGIVASGRDQTGIGYR